MPLRRWLRTGWVVVLLALVAMACSSDPRPRTLQEPSQQQPATTRDPDIARSAGDPLDTVPETPAETATDTPPPSVDTAPLTVGDDVASVVHVLGSIRSIPETVDPWQGSVPVIDNDLASVASLSCDRGDVCAPDAVTSWAAGRLEVVNVATSASVFDAAGLAAISSSLANSGVRTVGFGATADIAASPVIVQNNELGIAIHAVSLSAAPEVVATDDSPGIAGPQLLDRVLSSIGQSRTEGYGVVVLVDWGNLDQRAPTDAEVAAVRQLIDSGADAVVGHGSDFLQRFDQVGSAAVSYGLGNAITTNAEPLRSDTAILRLEFGTPGRSCLVPATATPAGPTQDDPSLGNCATR